MVTFGRREGVRRDGMLPWGLGGWQPSSVSYSGWWLQVRLIVSSSLDCTLAECGCLDLCFSTVKGKKVNLNEYSQSPLNG